jgi:ATP/ADP translocase
MRGVLVGIALSRYWRLIMMTSLDDKAAQSAQRAAMLRVFGGVFLAFFALLAVATYVRPDLMQMAMGMVKSMMP